MILQQTPPDTFTYMIAGYAVLAIVLGVYLVSYLVRFRNLKRDLAVLEDIAQNE